tara:strand:+ start:11673 stop:12842 length:1170 start_codon:yes stop_codon:yes gene_type:complete
MQIKDILLEYDRAPALAALGQKFIDAVVKDYLGYYGANWQGLTRAQELLKDPRLPSLVTRAIERIEQADPTPNKKYAQWMAREFSKGQHGLGKIEDIESTLSDYVHKFHLLNQKKKLPTPYNDINRYKNAIDLMGKMDEYEIDTDDNKVGQADKVYQDDLVTVIIPRDQEAACKYGRQTRWCTAAVHGVNYFDQYNLQGPLYILIPQKPRRGGEKYQLHFATRSWMDENDDPVMIGDLARKFPGLFSWFKAKNDNNMRQAFMLSVSLTSDSVLEKVSKNIWEIVHNDFLLPNDSWDDWDEIFDYAKKWVDLDPENMRQVVDLLTDKYPENEPTEGWDFLLNWDKVLNAWLLYKSKHTQHNVFASMGPWIQRHVIITDDGKTVGVDYYAG